MLPPRGEKARQLAEHLVPLDGDAEPVCAKPAARRYTTGTGAPSHDSTASCGRPRSLSLPVAYERVTFTFAARAALPVPTLRFARRSSAALTAVAILAEPDLLAEEGLDSIGQIGQAEAIFTVTNTLVSCGALCVPFIFPVAGVGLALAALACVVAVLLLSAWTIVRSLERAALRGGYAELDYGLLA